MWLATGRHAHPLDLSEDEITVTDVARGLANECRYAGHIRFGTPGYYSVAEHSVLVSIQAGVLARERGWSDAEALDAERWGLHHDDTEALIGDVIRPLKYQREMREFRRAEHRIERVIKSAFDLAPSQAVCDLVDEVDSRILTDEIAQVIQDPDMDRVQRKFGTPLGVTVHFLMPREAEVSWIERYEDLEFERARRRSRSR